MNNTSKQFNLVAMALMAGLYSAGATAATDTGDASVVISQPITITAVVDANFATIAAGTNATTVTVSTVNIVTAAPGLGNAIVIDNANQAALGFTLAGVDNQAYTLTIDPGSLAGPGAVMAVTATVPGTLPALVAAGSVLTFETILQVGADQVQGDYSTATGGTSLAITANYQ